VDPAARVDADGARPRDRVERGSGSHVLARDAPGRPRVRRPALSRVLELRAAGRTWAELARELRCTEWAARAVVNAGRRCPDGGCYTEVVATPHKLVTEVLALPADEREEVLRALLESLDEPGTDPGYEQAWDEEIERRARDDDEGADVFVDSAEVFREMRAEILRR
jgi:putative addiction module component (TIGR02574 family)